MNPADLTLITSPTLTSRPGPGSLSLGLKNGKIPIPRVDLEPIYTNLKTALGDQWSDYKTAVNAFVLGNLNQAELSWVLQPLLSSVPPVITAANPFASPLSTLHLHNTLLTALYANTLRDPPPTDVAPWVVTTDKPTAASKNAGAGGANDKAEERLKKEVMAIHPRDRRRVKTLKETTKAVNDGFSEMQDYRHELAVKPPEITPQSAGGLQKTNWDIEIRRRYAQPLAEETLEFPTLSAMQERIEPICYEEGLVGGAAQGALQPCAEIMEQATEVFLKELLGEMYAHTRANGEGCIQTNKFRRQLRKEEDEADRQVLERNPAGLLPVQLDVRSKREPLSIGDLQLALQLRDRNMNQDPFLSQKVSMNRIAGVQVGSPKVNGGTSKHMANGGLTNGERAGMEDAMAVNESDWSWRGGTKADTNELMSVLDECLAFG